MDNNDSSRTITSGHEPSQGLFDSEHLTRLTEGLRDAVNGFQGEATPENFAKIITAIGAFGLTGAKAWQAAREYTRGNPIKVALGAGLLFFAFRGLFASNERANRASTVYH